MIKILTILLCFNILLAPTYAFASAAEKWDIISNTFDPASQKVTIEARKITQDAANSGRYKVNVAVASETLGATLKRMLWIGAATAAVTSLIEGVGWVIDVGSQVIKKPAEPTNKTAPYIYQVGSASIAYSIANACKNYMTYMQTQSNNFGWGRTYQSYTLSVGSGNVPFYCALTFKYSDGTVYTDNPIEGSKRVNPDYNPSEPITYTPISDSDVGNLFLGTSSESNAPKSPVSSVITDAYDPNNPASDAPAPKQSNDALDSANPEPETDPKGDTSEKPNVDTDGDGVPDEYSASSPSAGLEFTFPKACEWFPAACDFFGVQKQFNKDFKENQNKQLEQDKTFFDKASEFFDSFSFDSDLPENESPEIADLPIPELKEDAVSWPAQCPNDVQVPINMQGVSSTITFSWSPWCQLLSIIKPAIVASAYIGAAFIVLGLRT
ncbi:virulence factor TspB C-terminal domain-related protein [Acinetobacter sp. GXMZU3951]